MDTKITKISDLKVGETYFFCLAKGIRFAKKGKLIAIINEEFNSHVSELTELYIDFGTSTNLLYAHEIGFGNTKIEAVANYGKFVFEANKEFSDSFRLASYKHRFSEK